MPERTEGFRTLDSEQGETLYQESADALYDPHQPQDQMCRVTDGQRRGYKCNLRLNHSGPHMVVKKPYYSLKERRWVDRATVIAMWFFGRRR